MLRKLVASTVFSAVFSTSAIAADPVQINILVVDESRFDWSGGYVGVHGGYNHFVDEYHDPAVPIFGSLNGSGGLVGLHTGINYQADKWVFGFEGDISRVGGSGQSVSDNIPVVFGKAEANWEASIRARAGIAKDNLLIYATGGVGWANYDFDFTFPTPAAFGQGDQFTQTVHGYTVGGWSGICI